MNFYFLIFIIANMAQNYCGQADFRVKLTHNIGIEELIGGTDEYANVYFPSSKNGNTYGVSIIRKNGSMGYKLGLFEVLPLCKSFNGLTKFIHDQEDGPFTRGHTGFLLMDEVLLYIHQLF